ncbi:MAG: TnpV protein [Anaerolineaceae bacterium]|nr:TnpV protein [Anaerolineaceae bacterium]
MDKLPEKITENGIPYNLHGEYYLPNIVLSSADDQPIGKWGWMHKKYLMEYRPVLYNHLVFTDQLHAYLVTVDEQAQSRLERIITGMAAAEGVNEALKAADQMEWVGRMNSIRNRAEEIIRDELIFT